MFSDPSSLEPLSMSNSTDDIRFTRQQIQKIERMLGVETLGMTFEDDFVEEPLGRIDVRGAAIALRWNETNEHGQIVVPYTFHDKYGNTYK